MTRSLRPFALWRGPTTHGWGPGPLLGVTPSRRWPHAPGSQKPAVALLLGTTVAAVGIGAWCSPDRHRQFAYGSLSRRRSSRCKQGGQPPINRPRAAYDGSPPLFRQLRGFSSPHHALPGVASGHHGNHPVTVTATAPGYPASAPAQAVYRPPPILSRTVPRPASRASPSGRPVPKARSPRARPRCPPKPVRSLVVPPPVPPRGTCPNPQGGPFPVPPAAPPVLL